MGIRSLYIVLLLGIFSTVDAQFDGVELTVSRNNRIFSHSAGFDPGGNGASLRAHAVFKIYDLYKAKIGAELGANGIGNYLSSSLGAFRPIDLPGDKLSLTVGLTTQHGFAFFYPTGLYMMGFAEENTVYYHFKNGALVGLFVELRYFTSPGYAEISSINSFFDIQYGLKFSFL
jgi:hypothetical protein